MPNAWLFGMSAELILGRQLTKSRFDVFDGTNRVPVLSAATAVTLGHALLAAEPEGLHEIGKHHLDEISAATAELSRLIAVKEKKADPRDASQRFDAGWSSVYARVEAVARAPREGAEGREARELIRFLFEEGLGWLRSPYVTKWGTSSAKLTKIESRPELRERLIALCSSYVFGALEDAHRALGEAIGIGVSTRSNARAIQAALRALPRRQPPPGRGTLPSHRVLVALLRGAALTGPLTRPGSSSKTFPRPTSSTGRSSAEVSSGTRRSGCRSGRCVKQWARRRSRSPPWRT
jgi:hypothetical protein